MLKKAKPVISLLTANKTAAEHLTKKTDGPSRDSQLLGGQSGLASRSYRFYRLVQWATWVGDVVEMAGHSFWRDVPSHSCDRFIRIQGGLMTHLELQVRRRRRFQPYVYHLEHGANYLVFLKADPNLVSAPRGLPFCSKASMCSSVCSTAVVLVTHCN